MCAGCPPGTTHLRERIALCNPLPDPNAERTLSQMAINSLRAVVMENNYLIVRTVSKTLT